MKDILIIGGSYFVGRIFVEELLKTGDYRVHVLNRGNIPMRHDEVHEIVCDRHDLNKMRELIPSKDWCAVVDFCAYTPGDISGTLGVLPEGRTGQYIYISTASVYDRVHDFPVREDAPKLTGPQPELGQFADYAYNKWRAEEELQKRCESSQLPHTSIRPAFIYGKYNYAPRENYFFDLIVKGEPVIIPEKNLALFSLVSAWDVAHITIGCIGNSEAFGRAFNASATELVSYERLVEVFASITGKNLDVRRMSIDEILERQIPLPFPLDEHLIYSGARVQSIMDFEYTPFLEGMAETYRFYRIGRGLD